MNERQKEQSAMTRIRLLGVSLMAVFAIFALTASMASAEEEKTKMLPAAGVSFTSKQVGEGVLEQKEGTFTVKCKKGKGSGTIETANLGKYTTLFEECKDSAGGKCTGASDAVETILNKGLFHFWLALELLNGKNTLVGALAFLPEELHFTCVDLGVNVLVLVNGCVAALATPLNELTTVTKDVFAQTGGVQLIIKVLPAGSTVEEECKLLSAVGAGAFKQSGLKGEAENENFKVGETKPTILLMNPAAVN
jgi:hypothetical protein